MPSTPPAEVLDDVLAARPEDGDPARGDGGPRVLGRVFRRVALVVLEDLDARPEPSAEPLGLLDQDARALGMLGEALGLAPGQRLERAELLSVLEPGLARRALAADRMQ